MLSARPHLALSAAVASILALEGFRGTAPIGTSPVWPVLQAAVAAAALALAWAQQESLRLRPVLALALALQLGWIVLHLALGVHSDFDSSHVYPRDGNALLDGRYPDSEYPPGAVLLFAFEALVSGGSGEGVRIAHAFAMLPFQIATVAGIWALRTPRSAWFAALVAVSPLTAFFSEFRFDPAPTAALVVGLVLAWRGRWTAAGVALGIGAALKWTPGLAAVALVVRLVASHRRGEAMRHGVAAVGTFALVNLPFLAVWPGNVLHAYRVQSARGISGESVFYVPLRIFGWAHQLPNSEIWTDVVTPGWARPVAIALQAVCVLLVLVVAARGGVPVAALAPAVFLLTNRIFSPQYLVTLVAAWAIAGSLLVRSKREQAVVGAAILGASLADVLVYPTVTPNWPLWSALLFLLAFAITVRLLFLAARR